MTVVDPIADFLARMRNAQMARHTDLTLPYSKIKHEIANVMLKNKFLAAVEKVETGKFPELKVTLPEKKLDLTRISHCGQRQYAGKTDIKKVKNGYGIAILSTSSGVMTGYEAHARGIGGELLCEVS